MAPAVSDSKERIGAKLRILTLLCVLAGAAPPAAAYHVVNAEVTQSEDRYTVDFVVILEAEPDRFWEIVTDYARFADFSPSVVASRIVRGAPGRDARVEITLRPCVLVVFCRTLTKVSDVRVDAGARRIEYRIVPASSDFRMARETVVLADASTDAGPRVRFAYTAVLSPKFFVPPFVGPWLIRRAVIEDLEAGSRRVERTLGGQPAPLSFDSN